MKLKFFTTLLVWCVPAIAALANFVPQSDNLAGNFRQTKTLTDMGISLVSTGVFHVQKNKGMLWENREPTRFGFLLTPDAAFQIDAAGTRKALPEAAAPTVRALYAIFSAAFSNDEKTLTEFFDFEKKSADSWTLVPVKKPLSDLIKKITLNFDKNAPKSVRLADASGDTTLIKFENVAPANDDLIL